MIDSTYCKHSTGKQHNVRYFVEFQNGQKKLLTLLSHDDFPLPPYGRRNTEQEQDEQVGCHLDQWSVSSPCLPYLLPFEARTTHQALGALGGPPRMYPWCTILQQAVILSERIFKLTLPHVAPSLYAPKSTRQSAPAGGCTVPVRDMPRITDATVADFCSHTVCPASNTLTTTICRYTEAWFDRTDRHKFFYHQSTRTKNQAGKRTGTTTTMDRWLGRLRMHYQRRRRIPPPMDHACRGESNQPPWQTVGRVVLSTLHTIPSTEDDPPPSRRQRYLYWGIGSGLKRKAGSDTEKAGKTF